MAKLTLANLTALSGSSWNGVKYFCTQRFGGVSQEGYSSFNLAEHVGDKPQAVAHNRRLLAAQLPNPPVWLNQVHGVEVVQADQIPAQAVPQADALITMQPLQPLAILTADCLPVVIADVSGQALGVAHAGWRGLLGGILENTCALLQKRLPQAIGWQAWIGPAICQQCYEVGADVYEAFTQHNADAKRYFQPASSTPQKWLANLSGLASYRLAKAGVQHVEISRFCTFCSPNQLYSYRRESVCGRQATIAWIQP